jgi:RNA polymerase subunit RPABC4/transcription elongation factor Spt4
MALITCKDCGHQVSPNADKCPNCGARAPKKSRAGTFAVVGVALAFIIVAIGTSTPPTAAKLTPAVALQSTAQTQEDKDFQTVAAGARQIKRSLKDPASFELIAAGVVEGKPKAICYEYRARNSFNALVVERRVIAEKGNSSSASDWNRYCAGKKATDFTRVRQVI